MGVADVTAERRAAVAVAVAAENAAVEELYENAPCGHLSTLRDGTIVKINTTLVGWLGQHREDLVGRRRLAELLTVGGRIYYETHIAPLLSMQNSGCSAGSLWTNAWLRAVSTWIGSGSRAAAVRSV